MPIHWRARMVAKTPKVSQSLRDRGKHVAREPQGAFNPWSWQSVLAVLGPITMPDLARPRESAEPPPSVKRGVAAISDM